MHIMDNCIPEKYIFTYIHYKHPTNVKRNNIIIYETKATSHDKTLIKVNSTQLRPPEQLVILRHMAHYSTPHQFALFLHIAHYSTPHQLALLSHKVH